jgi:uncharacterized repeat protein (TIGR01451 family)
MFKKIITNLPFQPDLLGTVAFYSYRLRKEQALRRIGFILMIMVLLLQLFAIFSPAESTLATSRSDIVYGAKSRDDVLSAYRNNRDQLGRRDIQEIFNHYGIGADQIAKAKKTTLKDSSRDYINTSRTTTKYPDTFVPIKGAVNGGIYEFELVNWRKGQYPNGYPALTGMTTYGFRFWILLKGCGNIVFEKGAKKPDFEIVKKRTSTSKIMAGGQVEYSIQFRNRGLATAKKVAIYDRLPAELTYKSYTSNLDLKLDRDGQLLKWTIKNKDSSLSPTTRWFTIKLKVISKKSLNATKQSCNTASIDASNAPKESTPRSCVTIAVPAAPKVEPPKEPEIKKEARLSTDKAVSNLTQKIEDANNTTAYANDVLRYTIKIENSGEAATTLALDGEYGESIADILEYANLTDKGDAQFNEETQFLSWPAVTVNPGQTIEKTFTVTIKDPIPATPTSLSNPLSFDYVLHNEYGRDVNVMLKKTPTKQVEETVAVLPNTGPSASMMTMSVLALIVGYFFYRSRLLSKELDIIQDEYRAGAI